MPVAVESAVIEPVDVLGDGELEVVDVVPGPAVPDQFDPFAAQIGFDGVTAMSDAVGVLRCGVFHAENPGIGRYRASEEESH
ncbi:hypothetical protein [Cryobacterium sp. GrIS_2_6]|uniref:hypothetical protein n=1 Tax=Cryobacterium sp. GrIS_2_6 TaxID=3162785 RepID=UPI002E05F5FD|nr:hypothetical protein [Cryobacterium psychrotolerans]